MNFSSEVVRGMLLQLKSGLAIVKLAEPKPPDYILEATDNFYKAGERWANELETAEKTVANGE